LDRHGWRKLMPRPFHPDRNIQAQIEFKKGHYKLSIRLRTLCEIAIHPETRARGLMELSQRVDRQGGDITRQIKQLSAAIPLRFVFASIYKH
jgi:hypothetical protein